VSALQARPAPFPITLLWKHPEFQSVAGTAEDTGLPTDSVDVVTAAQAFHWFDVEKASREFRRILREEGTAALIWNVRDAGGTQFLNAYEHLLEEWGSGYTDVRASRKAEESIVRFFGQGEILRGNFPNEQVLDHEAFEARFLSSSYAPPRDDARGPAALSALRRLFHDHAVDGAVRMTYDAQIFYGPLQG
jgi:SAM-dependent methyltransferase